MCFSYKKPLSAGNPLKGFGNSLDCHEITVHYLLDYTPIAVGIPLSGQLIFTTKLKVNAIGKKIPPATEQAGGGEKQINYTIYLEANYS